MKILHYFLGFPPYRSGGLTKYAIDLMESQVADGNTVAALWPGRMKLSSKKVSIKRGRDVNKVGNYEIVNPLPVPLDEGIKKPAGFMQSTDIAVYIAFLGYLKPDVIHIHTLMGLHKEFVDAAKQLGIRTVFTTHDYFGLCPKVTLYRNRTTCSFDKDCSMCAGCNSSALSDAKIYLLQSPLYRAIKNSKLVKLLRRNHRAAFFDENQAETESINTASANEDYKKLRDFYISILNEIDLIQYNSELTRSVYERYLNHKNSKVLTITHKNISDNRETTEHIESDKLRLICLAPAKPFKGFGVIKAALDKLWESGRRDFELRLFSPVENPSEYMIITEDFSYDEMPKIFAAADVLVAPSVWYETFGFTVLEALSYGVPVITSEHVGAKDIAKEGAIIVEAGSVESFMKAVESLNAQTLEQLRQGVMRCEIKTWNAFMKENYELYKSEK